MDATIAKYLSNVTGVVWATSYEQLCLWKESRQFGTPWEEARMGYWQTIGHINEKPVNIRLVVEKVRNVDILFIEAVSAAIDKDMIVDWLLKNLPRTAFNEAEHLNQVNAMNFCNVFPRRQGSC